MLARHIMQSVRFIFKGVWKGDLEKLVLMINAAFLSRRLGVAILGRSANTCTPKHAIKRVGRLTCCSAPVLDPQGVVN